MTARRLVGLLVTLAACLTLWPALATAATPRASLTQIEGDVMCPSCRESLAVAQSPQAEAERNYIRGLIAQGLDRKQIESNLVSQYGEAVLAKPPADGFNLTVYVLPAVVVLVGLTVLALVLPRWRAAARARRGQPVAPGPAISSHEAQRLDEELSRYPG